ncbi:flagellar protein FliO/FliZ [Gracilibacillus ureilyticus]|uniref:Flagellar protein FliO/FliZ n=1 Tax=Gracilibacillus ureilyticus TaxID=531814 RepID=A0A1H9L677_9BACI|nr:flagellar biosynthetic protein FliO [Gracilibacillus ureilyticus]SER06657.1 flagellar protein FliO/FliZ [Gracilibacillus ureilyticus]
MKQFRNILVITIVSLFFVSFYDEPVSASQSVLEHLENSEQNNEETGKTVEDDELETSVENSETTIQSTSFLGSLFKLLIALAVVIGLIYLIANFLKKRNKYLGRNQVLESYGGITLGTNKSVQIVRIGERYFAVGLADNIELLLEITDMETIEQIKQSDDIQTQPLDFIKEKMTKNDKRETTPPKREFGQLFHKELEEMKEGRKKMLQKMKEKEKDHGH